MRGLITEDRVVEAFEQMDVDHSGKITCENLQSLLGREFSPPEVCQMIAEMDATNKEDCMIPLEKLVSAFRNHTDAIAQKTLGEGMLVAK